MKLRHLFALVVAVGFGVQVAPDGSIGVRAAHADAALDLAKSKFAAAMDAMERKSFNEAGQLFLDAHALRTDLVDLLHNAAVAYENQATANADAAAYDKAAEMWRRFVAASPGAPNAAELNGRADKLTAEAVALRANPSAAGATPSAAVAALGAQAVHTGVYIIESDPKAATIYLDSDANPPLGVTPWSGVITGQHTVIIKARGRVPKTKVLATAPSGLVVESFSLAVMDTTGHLVVESDPPGASVFLDDKSRGAIGTTPYSAAVLPGKYKLIIAADGYDDYVTDLDVAEGEAATKSAKLNGAPVGYLNMRGDGIEDAKVYIDGELRCEGACRPALRQGSYQVKVTRPGYKTVTRQVEISVKAETTVRIEMAEIPGRGDAIGAYVLAGAFTGGGIFLGMRANKLEDELRAAIDAGAPPVDETDPRFTRGKIYAIAADAAYALGAVTFLTAVYYTFRDKGPPSRLLVDTKTLALTPAVGATYAGLDLEVRW